MTNLQCDAIAATIKNCVVKASFKSDAEYDDDESSCLTDLQDKWQHLINIGAVKRV